jgi:hypothetical protein
MKSKHLAVLTATAAFLAVGGITASTAQAVTDSVGLQPGVPLSPMSVGNAVRSAEAYLKVDGFSRQGLIRQLVDVDEYSAVDATTAVDSLSVDWNQQAVKSAKSYLKVDGFSHGALVNQLVDVDSYTSSQAEYGVEAVGL